MSTDQELMWEKLNADPNPVVLHDFGTRGAGASMQALGRACRRASSMTVKMNAEFLPITTRIKQ